MADLWIKNVRVGTAPESVDITIRDGRIATIGPPQLQAYADSGTVLIRTHVSQHPLTEPALYI